MADRRAKRLCETDLIKLKASVEYVSELTTIPEDGRKPDVSHLGRKLNVQRTNWDSFEGSHGALFSLLTVGEEVVEVRAMYEQQLALYREALDRGESLHAELQGLPLSISRRGSRTVYSGGRT